MTMDYDYGEWTRPEVKAEIEKERQQEITAQQAVKPPPVQEIAQQQQIVVKSATTGPDKYIVDNKGRQQIMTGQEIIRQGSSIPERLRIESEIHQAVLRGENYEIATERIAGEAAAKEKGMTGKELTSRIKGKNREEQLQNYADKYGLSLTSAAKLIKEYNDNPDSAKFKSLNRWERRDLAEFEGAKDYIFSTADNAELIKKKRDFVEVGTQTNNPEYVTKAEAERIKAESPTLYDQLKRDGVSAYNQSVKTDERLKAAEVELSEREFKKALKEQPKEIQDAYEKDGYEGYNKAVKAYNERVDKENTRNEFIYESELLNIVHAADSQMVALDKLNDFKAGADSYDVAKFLRRNPDDIKTLTDAGFDSEAIAEAKGYNYKYLGIGAPDNVKPEKFITDYFKEKGWKIEPLADISKGSILPESEYTKRLKEASDKYQEKYAAPMTLRQFQENYFEDKGWDMRPGLFSSKLTDSPDKYKAEMLYSTRLKEASDEYIEKFGTAPIIQQSIENAYDFLVPGYYVATKWDQLTPASRAVNIAIDVVFIASFFAKPITGAVKSATMSIGREMGEAGIKIVDDMAMRLRTAALKGDMVAFRAEAEYNLKLARIMEKANTPGATALRQRAEAILRNIPETMAMSRIEPSKSLRETLNNLARQSQKVSKTEGGFLEIERRQGKEIKPRTKTKELPISKSEARELGLSDREIEALAEKHGYDRAKILSEARKLASQKKSLEKLLKQIETDKATKRKEMLQKAFDDINEQLKKVKKTKGPRTSRHTPTMRILEKGRAKRSAKAKVSRKMREKQREIERAPQKAAEREAWLKWRDAELAKEAAQTKGAVKVAQVTKLALAVKTKTSVKPSTKTQQQLKPATETKTLTQTQTQVQAKTQTALKTQPKTKTETNTALDTKLKPVTQTLPEAKTLPATKQANDTELKTKTAAKPDTMPTEKILQKPDEKPLPDTFVKPDTIKPNTPDPTKPRPPDSIKPPKPPKPPEPPKKDDPDKPIKGKIKGRGTDEKKKEWTPEDVKSAIAWKDGFVVHAIKSPYRRGIDEKSYNVDNLPKGMIVMQNYKGQGSQSRSAKVTGKFPGKLTVDVGNQDVIITKNRKGVNIRHSYDNRRSSSMTTISKKKGRIYRTRAGGSEIFSRRPMKGY